MMENTYYSIKEVAEILKVTETTVKRWVRVGKLKAVKIDRLIRIPAEEIKPKNQKLED